MDPNQLYFLLLVAAGALVQTITGFAMALIIVGGVAALSLADIGASAAVVSLVGLVNTTVALRHNYRSVDVKFLIWLSIGLIPLMLAGILLLELLSRTASDLLQNLLGIMIISAGILLMLKPKPYQQTSARITTILVGASGGLIGGMFGAAGAPYAYLMYRQPMNLVVIRATLLAVFAVATSCRTVMVGFYGHLDREVLTLAALSVPIVIVITLFAGRIAHLLPDVLVRKIAFGLLILLGGFLILG